MARTDADGATGGRKRQLNIIYFVDSARTRSLTLPLGRLNILLGGMGLVIAWSIASIFLVVWLVRGREQQSLRMRNALATIFEYETRDDKVFDLAYPPETPRDSLGSEAPAVSQAAPPAPAKAVAAAPAVEPKTVAKASDEDGSGDAPVAAAKLAAKAPSAVKEAKAAPAVKPPRAKEGGGVDESVQVGNPVLEAGDSSLQLRFDLTSKHGSDRVEGYIWAVAEFRSDSGERLMIGAPSDIQVKADGEPTYPLKSALFGIRRFKQKSFSFQFPKGKAGTFTGVRIGIMDRSGTNKTTYNVPVQIRVDQGAEQGVKDGGGAAPAGTPQSG